MAPVMRTGDMPPISAQICFQVQPFSRLIPSSFSVNASRVVADVVAEVMAGLLAYGRSAITSKGRAKKRHLRWRCGATAWYVVSGIRASMAGGEQRYRAQ